MSTAAKMTLAEMALALRDEQVEAHIVHYKRDLETSPELDAVTAQVVEELRALKDVARNASSANLPAALQDPEVAEQELIESLRSMLARIFRHGKLATFSERKLTEIAKRFARSFFESELHDKLRGSSTEEKTMRFPEQSLYHLMSRMQPELIMRLADFDYENEDTYSRASERLAEFVRELRNEYLARTTPELNQLIRFLNETLTIFFTTDLPLSVGDLAWQVVKEAKLIESPGSHGYKISKDAFPRFRQVFERCFLERLVPVVEDEMLTRVRAAETKFREETIRFVADPLIFSDLCEIMCDSVYDMLYNDGFLDLPGDWRARLQGKTGGWQ
jgi:hypothetical protein